MADLAPRSTIMGCATFELCVADVDSGIDAFQDVLCKKRRAGTHLRLVCVFQLTVSFFRPLTRRAGVNF